MSTRGSNSACGAGRNAPRPRRRLGGQRCRAGDEVTLNGKTQTDLASYVVTTDLTELPANNLLSADAGLSMNKGYFMAVAPVSRGTHTLHAYDEFYDGGFQAGITSTINVH